MVVDGFHPKMPLDSSAETCGQIMVFSAKVEQCGHWPVLASTFFFISKNVTGEIDRSAAHTYSCGGSGWEFLSFKNGRKEESMI